MGQPIEITRTDLSAAALRTLAGRSDDAAVVRRLLAIALVLDGRPRDEAASLNGMTRQTLSDWVHRYNAEGVAGLRSRTGPGRPPFLTEARMEELRAIVLAGPDRKRHKVVRWRCAELCDEVAERWSIRVCEQTMGKWLRRLEMTRLQPRPYHPRKDPEAEVAFKKTFPTWCRKYCPTRPRASRSKSGFRTKPGSGSKARWSTSGHRSDRALVRCATTAMTRSTCSAHCARLARLVLRSSCRRPTAKP